MEDQGKINAYTCDRCQRKFITRNADSGCTPFVARCLDSSCTGHAQSAFYMVPQTLTPYYEWYKPSDHELAAMQLNPELLQTVDHVKKGGLLLRKIGGPTWLESWQARNPSKTERKPYEARQMNDDPGPRLVVGGCRKCGSFRITLWETAMYEGSCTAIFSEHELMEEALSEACFWGNIMGIPVEIEDGWLGDLVGGDILIRGSNGEIITGASS